ncbi:MAG: DUF3488 and DUF4129 domain-containing transglutaminase family protein [Thermoanaerobaculales bacterium]
MRAGLERQRWFAGLALLVALPLPLTGVASWPFFAAFVAVAGLVLAARRPLPPLRPWVENLLAPAILVAVVAAGGGYKYGLLRPLAHLGVLVTAVRLPGSAQRSRGFLTGAMLGVVAVAGIASSTDLSLVPYLLGLLAYVVVAGGRLVTISLAERDGGGERARAWPPVRLIVGSVAVAVMVAAPVFVLLPRLRSPFAAAPLGGGAVSGFRDRIALNEIGDIKLSRRVVMRIAFPGTNRDRVSPDLLLEAGATMRIYRGGAWVDGRIQRALITARGGHPIVLVPAPTSSDLRRAAIEIEADPSTVFLPLGAVSVELPDGVVVARDSSGTLRPQAVDPPLRYEARFDPVHVQQPPPDRNDLELPSDASDLRDLAGKMIGSTTNTLAAALIIEQHLQTNYRYSLSVHPPLREDPVRWFLFSSREGHCEFFASSMVLLLRTLGIPARLQAGFAGGDWSRDGSFVVRDSNAHAWVLAWIDDRQTDRRSLTGSEVGDGGATVGASLHRPGHWQVFDPTPLEGRPGFGGSETEAGLRLRWEQLSTVWDRWVLTFSLADQVEAARRLVEAVARNGLALVKRALALALIGAAGIVLWRTRHLRRKVEAGYEPRAPAITRALDRVVTVACKAGVAVSPGTTPRQFALRATTAYPSVTAGLSWLIEAHERSRYAGGGAPTRAELRSATHAIVRAIKDHAHRRLP